MIVARNLSHQMSMERSRIGGGGTTRIYLFPDHSTGSVQKTRWYVYDYFYFYFYLEQEISYTILNNSIIFV